MGRTLGQVAFEAYNVAKGGVTYDGRPIPPWSEVGDAVREAWEASAYAVADVVIGEVVGKALLAPLRLDRGEPNDHAHGVCDEATCARCAAFRAEERERGGT